MRLTLLVGRGKKVEQEDQRKGRKENPSKQHYPNHLTKYSENHLFLFRKLLENCIFPRKKKQQPFFLRSSTSLFCTHVSVNLATLKLRLRRGKWRRNLPEKKRWFSDITVLQNPVTPLTKYGLHSPHCFRIRVAFMTLKIFHRGGSLGTVKR